MTTQPARNGATVAVPEQQHSPTAHPERVGQATAVEQSRAVAEVQAAVFVARQFPRSMTDARLAMQEACRDPRLADRAFYRFPRGGQQVSGASIHLARELARCYGNLDYGIAEMRRDDLAGQSEMRAWAWDQQTNVRPTSTFIVPHMRDKRGKGTDRTPERLVDLRDIYENNANNGARRLREMIFAVLPGPFVAEAEELCRATLERGDGSPLEQRIHAAIDRFEGLGVDQGRIELKLGRPADRWNGYDLAQLTTIFQSISRREITVEDEFPPERITTADAPAGGEQAPRTKG